jgi:hypothetical protein
LKKYATSRKNLEVRNSHPTLEFEVEDGLKMKKGKEEKETIWVEMKCFEALWVDCTQAQKTAIEMYICGYSAQKTTSRTEMESGTFRRVRRQNVHVQETETWFKRPEG